MAEKTEIAWCDSTFNPWIGCMKVSPGCDHCYAETLMDTRYRRVSWGQRKTEDTIASVGTRSRTSAAYWRQPHNWNRQHVEFRSKHGHRQRIFCSSLADVFDNQAPDGAQPDLWALIDATPNLDWPLLTKRPENILKIIPPIWRTGLPRHVWIGVTAEDQDNYDRRMDILKEVPAAVHFVSYEPAIGPLVMTGLYPSWVICGGESGPGHRDMDPSWARAIQRQCRLTGTAFFMKQMAGKKPIPDDLLTRQFPD